ncbi:type IV secretory pathway VirB10-like protein [Sphingobium sp. OAS761]|uniref:hypothetical protein n=1 Tax=Sphingobium sp. OAS761 TaxID=2817901 RepID=UPI00209E2431|nr:hypothetical protein [Sphingobium sp. OAS761]MCP1469396.1 type IV secretory pathway VirB10-like protein [Sphingobium sp. OAS761]
MRKIALIALSGALALSACGKSPEEDAHAVNNMVEPPVENVIVQEPDALPPPEPANNAVATPVAPPPSVSEQQQILDDAEASGMTSRLPAGDEGSRPAGEASTTGE